jgi:WD40 repeat protein
VYSVSFDKDGGKMVSGGQDSTIKVWDLLSWSREHHLLFSQATQRRVILLLWLNKRILCFPADILDLLVQVCI